MYRRSIHFLKNLAIPQPVFLFKLLLLIFVTILAHYPVSDPEFLIDFFGVSGFSGLIHFLKWYIDV